MSNISELKDSNNLQTLHLVLLTVATCGIYAMLWFYKNNQTIASVTKTKLFDNTLALVLIGLFGWSGFSDGLGDESLTGLDGLLSLALSVLMIVWSFKAKKAIEDYALREYKLVYRMNGFYTFLFNFFYINYCMNELPEEQKKAGTSQVAHAG